MTNVEFTNYMLVFVRVNTCLFFSLCHLNWMDELLHLQRRLHEGAQTLKYNSAVRHGRKEKNRKLKANFKIILPFLHTNTHTRTLCAVRPKTFHTQNIFVCKLNRRKGEGGIRDIFILQHSDLKPLLKLVWWIRKDAANHHTQTSSQLSIIFSYKP